MQTAQLNIKIDPKLKKQAEKIAEALGFNVSTLLKAFLLNFIREKKVSFSLEAEKNDPSDLFPNKNDPFGDGLTGKDIEREMVKYGYSKEEAKRNGKSYDGMLKAIKENQLTVW